MTRFRRSFRASIATLASVVQTPRRGGTLPHPRTVSATGSFRGPNRERLLTRRGLAARVAFTAVRTGKVFFEHKDTVPGRDRSPWQPRSIRPVRWGDQEYRCERRPVLLSRQASASSAALDHTAVRLRSTAKAADGRSFLPLLIREVGVDFDRDVDRGVGVAA